MYSSLSSEGVTPVKIKNHPVYFLTGGDVHFQVKNYRFRIHRYFFERESAFWRERLASPTSAGQSPKGSLDNPFILEDVHPDDFSRFLWVFYNPQYSIYDATVEDWTAVLKLAFDWRFQEVKKLVTRELEKFALDPVFKIELYQSYELDRKLLIPAFIQLCTRPEPIDVKEGRQLGIETALLVAQARERARSSRVATPTEFADTELASVIKDVFGIVEPAVSALSPLAGTSGCGAFTGVKSKTQDPVTPITASASMSAFNGSSNNPFGNVDALANGNGTNGSTATGSSTPSGGQSMLSESAPTLASELIGASDVQEIQRQRLELLIPSPVKSRTRPLLPHQIPVPPAPLSGSQTSVLPTARLTQAQAPQNPTQESLAPSLHLHLPSGPERQQMVKPGIRTQEQQGSRITRPRKATPMQTKGTAEEGQKDPSLEVQITEETARTGNVALDVTSNITVSSDASTSAISRCDGRVQQTDSSSGPEAGQTLRLSLVISEAVGENPATQQYAVQNRKDGKDAPVTLPLLGGGLVDAEPSTSSGTSCPPETGTEVHETGGVHASDARPQTEPAGADRIAPDVQGHMFSEHHEGRVGDLDTCKSQPPRAQAVLPEEANDAALVNTSSVTMMVEDPLDPLKLDVAPADTAPEREDATRSNDTTAPLAVADEAKAGPSADQSEALGSGAEEPEVGAETSQATETGEESVQPSQAQDQDRTENTAEAASTPSGVESLIET